MIAKEIISDYLRVVWVEHDVDAVDLAQHNPALPDGKDPLKAFLRHLFGELSPRLEWRVLRIIAEGDLVVAHSLAISEPATRGTVVVDLFRLVDGRIVEHWDVSQDVPEVTASGRPVY